MKNSGRKGTKAPDNASLSSEVDELLGSAGSGRDGGGARFFEDDKPISADDFSAARAKKKRRVSAGAVVFRVLLILLVLALGAAVAIMEPWVPPDEELDADPASEKLAPRTIAVGETYAFEVPLDTNERISETAVSDTALLALGEGGVTGLGEYFEPVTVSFTTMEIEVPEAEPKHHLVIGVRDYSAQLDSARSFLRDLVGIEKKKAPRTEPAVLHRYEQEITVEGLEPVTEESAYVFETYLGAVSGIELAVGDGLTLLASSNNSGTAAVSCEVSGAKAVLNVEGAAAGKTKAVIDFGFYKQVDAETYARWVEWEAIGEEAPVAETTAEGDDTTRTTAAEGESAEADTRIFIPTRRLILPVTVTDLAAPFVPTELYATEQKTASDYAAGYNASLAEDTLDIINEARKAEGLADLEWSGDLADLAEDRAQALGDSFAVSASEGARAELIGGGFETARAAADAWLAVPETRAALMSAEATAFGCSLWRSTGTDYDNYWCGVTG